MRVLNYLELESALRRSGIGTATRHQRAALADTDVELITSPWNGGSLPKAVLKGAVGDAFMAQYDIAHCNLIGPGSVAVARHARRNDIPLVLHAHTTRENTAGSFRGSRAIGPAYQRYLAWFYSQADLLLCPSEYTKTALEAYPVDAPIRSVTNGVDIGALEGFEALRDPCRRRYGLEGEVVFTVGNVFERKGLTTFCRLAESLDREFVWFGPYDTGPHASPTVREWVGDPPSNVTFTGWVEDIRDAYGAGDIYLFPTKAESQGIAVLEAMACGKPVVLRDIPVFEEFYTDGEDCLKCETFAEFRSALRRLAENPELRERLGENARATADEHALSGVAEALRDAYESARRRAG